MKRAITLAAIAVCATTLGACVYHSPMGPSRLYYDGAYGAYNGGFWGADGVFYYYTDATRTAAKRDDEHHFRAGERPGDMQVLAQARRDRNAERVANGLPPLEERAELKYYAR